MLPHNTHVASRPALHFEILSRVDNLFNIVSQITKPNFDVAFQNQTPWLQLQAGYSSLSNFQVSCVEKTSLYPETLFHKSVSSISMLWFPRRISSSLSISFRRLDPCFLLLLGLYISSYTVANLLIPRSIAPPSPKRSVRTPFSDQLTC